jgi:hypothetical protein
VVAHVKERLAECKIGAQKLDVERFNHRNIREL